MEQLAERLREVQRGLGGDTTEVKPRSGEGQLLERAAIEWASFALQTFEGDLLKRALDVSAALVTFVAEMEDR